MSLGCVLEIERKYSIPVELYKRLKNEGLFFNKEKLSQFYTNNDSECVIRFRKSDEIYYKTIKKGSGLVRSEIEEQIDQTQYDEAKPHIILCGR